MIDSVLFNFQRCPRAPQLGRHGRVLLNCLGNRREQQTTEDRKPAPAVVELLVQTLLVRLG
ncbi:MAG TPA: hypothetical protein VGR78_14705 [Verrucomicrobiae bacterium]|nr:hypothetical protein [Verrucomicrobiae bacterium]